MSMRPEQGLEYLEKHGIPHFLESIMIGLVHDRPDDPLSYIETCIGNARKLGGTASVLWNSFLADSEELPKSYQRKESYSKRVFPTETPLQMMMSQERTDHIHEQELDGSCPTCDQPMDDKQIVFVIGGPGSGKGTQCERIVNEFGYTHLSSGDLLRAEVASGSERGLELKATMERGDLVPLSTILKLIKDNIEAHPESKGFLIDGYPRDVAQGIEFEKTVGPCSMVLWLDVSQDTMVKRLLKRGETSGRVDDNEETIRKRLQTFVGATEPVIKYYQERNKVCRADSELDIETVFEDVRKMFK